MRKLIVALVVLSVVAAACNDDAETDGTTAGATDGTRVTTGFQPGDIQFFASLVRFDACDDVLDHFITEALQRVGPYGLEGSGPIGIPFAVMEQAADDGAFAVDLAPAATTAAAEFVEGDDFSGTNVQEVGVDEPDIVKTDGSRIVTVVDGTLTYIDVTGGTPEVLGTLFLGDDTGWDHRMFVSGDRAIVFGRGGGPIVLPADIEGGADAIVPEYFGPLTTIVEIDLSDPSDLEVVRRLQIEGTYLSARLVDGTVRAVVSAFPADLPFVFPSNPSAEEAATAANRAVVESSTLDTWLPSFTLLDGEGDVLDSGLAVACEAVHAPTEFAGFDTLAVLSFDMDAGPSVEDAASVIAAGEQVYASTESLYVATNVWIPQELIGTERVAPIEQDFETAIHKFDITGGGAARYEASGTVRGHLLNQFAMSESDGYFRVATTEGAPWSFREEAESFVTVLEQRGDELAEVGRVGDLGRGERIFSVRYVGDLAYVVTFRQVDPFYVVDLSDPGHPEVVGELKIPGFSSYLHPIGDDMVLGVGSGATDEGRVTGAKVSLFDVSDPTSPEEVAVWTMDDASSEVAWDHLAFLYWAPDDAAVLPVQAWEQQFWGAVVLEPFDGLDERGRIVHERDEGRRGRSDCEQVIAGSQFGEDVIVQVCGQDESGGASGYYCEVFPTGDGFEGELDFILEEFGVDIDLDAIVGPDDRVELCWRDFGPESEPILRSLVIGETLWTLTRSSLQSNDLASLDLLDRIDI